MRSTSHSLLAAFLALAASTCLESTLAFAPSLTVAPRSMGAATVVLPPSPLVLTALQAEAEEGGAETETEAAADEEEEEEEEEVEEENEKKEDPEVKALKEEIEKLESKLKSKKSEIDYLKDSCETYSKTGYARKVAEMENMRRARKSMASSNKDTSMANVLQSFLPVKEKLDLLRQEYAEDDFGKAYVALAGNFNTALAELGVTDYAVSPGDSIDRSRVLVVDEEYSTEFPKNTVIRATQLGLELKGNVIRLAECVASLGEESSEQQGEEEASEAGEEAAEEPVEE